MSETHVVCLGLGANIGDRVATLRAAVVALGGHISVKRVSSVWDTAPLLVEDQPRFLNAALVGETTLDPFALLQVVKALETRLGRQPSRRYGPRAIDIDVLLYGAWQVDSMELVIPHPRLAERIFALAPLAEIAPDIQWPNVPLTVAELLARAPSTDARRLDMTLT